MVGEHHDHGSFVRLGEAPGHPDGAVELQGLAHRPVGVHEVRLLVDVGPLDQEDEALVVPREHAQRRLGHLVEHGLVGRVVVIDHVGAVRERRAPALRHLVECHVHVAVAEEPEEAAGWAAGHVLQPGGVLHVGEAGALELGDQVAAGIGGTRGGGGELPAGDHVGGQAGIVGRGASGRSELGRGEEPPATAAEEHGEAAAGALVEVLIDDPCAGVAIAGVDGVRRRGGVLDVGGGHDAERRSLHPVQVLAHVLDARLEEGVRDVGRVHALLVVVGVVAGRVAGHSGSGVGDDAVQRVGRDQPEPGEGVHLQAPVRVAPADPVLHDPRGSAVRRRPCRRRAGG